MAKKKVASKKRGKEYGGREVFIEGRKYFEIPVDLSDDTLEFVEGISRDCGESPTAVLNVIVAIGFRRHEKILRELAAQAPKKKKTKKKA